MSVRAGGKTRRSYWFKVLALHFARMDLALWYVHRSPTQREKAMKEV